MQHCLFFDTGNACSTIAILTKDKIIGVRNNLVQTDHGSTINLFMEEMLIENGLQLKDLDEVWVQNGPGSYTGLRIGLSTAKGICYALNKPLFLMHHFDWLFHSIPAHQKQSSNVLIMKAREAEYYAACYDEKGLVLMPPTVIFEEQLQEYLSQNSSACFSNMELIDINNYQIAKVDLVNEALIPIIFGDNKKQFQADLFLSEPFYLKNVHINKINNL
jgi:tRNA threonylcarbamoyladenosine biosynthesis protein TsaB